jgi:hypothetical protein
MERDPSQPETTPEKPALFAAAAIPHASNAADALSWLRVWDDPDRQAAQFSQTVVDVERKYGRFFQHLGDWPPERREALKHQLALNQLAIMQAIVPKRLPMTEEQLTAQGEALRKVQVDNEQHLRGILGEADYHQFEGFEKTRAYVTTVDDIANAMRAKGVRVSDEMEQSILSGYAAAMAATAAKAKDVNPRQLTEAQRAELRERQHRELQLQLLKQLSGVLEERDLNSLLESYIEQQEGS